MRKRRKKFKEIRQKSECEVQVNFGHIFWLVKNHLDTDFLVPP